MARHNPYLNLVGQKINKLLILSISLELTKRNNICLDCVCDCGKKVTLPAYKVKSGNTTSCGCSRRIVLDGKRFGSLTVLGFDEERTKKEPNRKTTYQKVQCDCGEIRSVQTIDLKTGNTKSCGCQRGTHKKTLTSTYFIWKAMKQRCHNPNVSNYHNYGGRGIKVCDRWFNSFENFLEDMGERPEGLTLDRIDVNGNYEPNNCRWATWVEQNNNKREPVKK